ENVSPGSHQTISSSPSANTVPPELRKGTDRDPQSAGPVLAHGPSPKRGSRRSCQGQKTARLRLSSGGIGAPRLIHKLVKPGKVVPSCRPNETRIDQPLIVETETDMGTADATVLGKADSAVGGELGGLNLADCGSDEVAKFQALLF